MGPRTLLSGVRQSQKDRHGGTTRVRRGEAPSTEAEGGVLGVRSMGTELSFGKVNFGNKKWWLYNTERN